MANAVTDRAIEILGESEVAEAVKAARLRKADVTRLIDARGEAAIWTLVIRFRLASASLKRSADQLHVSVNELSKALRLPPRTAHRRLARREKLTSEETERSVRVARVLAKAQDLLGDEQGRGWVLQPNRALGGDVPISLLDTADGFIAVMDELGRLEYGVIS
jgi:putative toxin-antitoxin system antitoxin component (TIGR02293 family)